MKLFKKLMAAVLVGAMALTMLVGCGSSVDKKEMIKMINDSYGGRVEFKDAGSGQADKVISLLQKAYDETENKAEFEPFVALFGKDYKESEYDEELGESVSKADTKAVKEALGITNTDDNYYLAIGEVKSYDSQYNQNHVTANELTSAMRNSFELNDAKTAGNKGTVSIDTVKLGDKEYLVMVIMRVA